MRRLVFVVAAVVMALVGSAVLSEAGRLPKPISTIKRQKTDDHHNMASLHKNRGPKAERRGTKPTPADEDRDKRRTHALRDE